MNKVLCFTALCCLLMAGSVAQAGMQVFQFGNIVAVALDDQSDMNWLEIYQVNSTLVIEGAGMTNIFVPVWIDRDKCSANSVDRLMVAGSDGSDIIVNQTGIPMYAMGNAGSDILIGGSGDDELHGGDDEDALFGRGGNDDLYGEGDADGLSGGPGKDYIDMGGQSFEQFMHGDSEADIFARYGWQTRRGFAALRVTFADTMPSPQELVALVGVFIEIDPIIWGDTPHDVSGAEGDVFFPVLLN